MVNQGVSQDVTPATPNVGSSCPSGSARGVPVAVADDAPVPAEFTAATEHVYSWLLVSEETRMGDVGELPVPEGVQVAT